MSGRANERAQAPPRSASSSSSSRPRAGLELVLEIGMIAMRQGESARGYVRGYVRMRVRKRSGVWSGGVFPCRTKRRLHNHWRITAFCAPKADARLGTRREAQRSGGEQARPGRATPRALRKTSARGASERCLYLILKGQLAAPDLAESRAVTGFSGCLTCR